jgi:energy-coupling factor transporter ATP-binding protein EcfA2
LLCLSDYKYSSCIRLNAQFMAINSIHLDGPTFSELGIGLAELPLDNPPLNLHSLGAVVVVAGTNGAGKSRLLRLIESLAPKVLSDTQVMNYRAQQLAAEEQYRTIEVARNQILGGANQFNNDADRDAKLAHFASAMATFQSEIKGIERALKANAVLTVTPPGPFTAVNFVPGNPQLVDGASSPDTTVSQRATALLYGGSENAEVNSPAYARSILRAAMQARDEARDTGNMDGTAAAAETELRKIVHILLGSSFYIGLNDGLNLRMGRKNGESYTGELSKGQQVLFQLACMLHAQGERLRNSIILLDEPENHLHPAVLNEVVTQLRHARGVGQVWVATHSVPLIAHMLAIDPDCLWYAEDGRFSRAGRAPMRVLEGLMGGANAAADLQALTRLPAQYAAMRFLSECLVEPGVVGPDTKDPQTNQIVEIISDMAKSRVRALRVVDFGAGVGRLLTTLVACVPHGPLAKFVDYRALEPDLDKHKELKQEIKAGYGMDESNRIFSDVYELNAGLDVGSVDCIVMCNVLHEISPDDWISLFAIDGPMMSSLAPDGYMLFVEDYGIPVGERAHRYGFLLLDEEELTFLFDIRESDRQEKAFVRVSSSQRKYQDRLVAHLVSKHCATRVTAATRRVAIKRLSERTRGQVATYLDASPGTTDGAAGRNYARNAQLFANASIWLNMHGETVSK